MVSLPWACGHHNTHSHRAMDASLGDVGPVPSHPCVASCIFRLLPCSSATVSSPGALRAVWILAMHPSTRSRGQFTIHPAVPHSFLRSDVLFPAFLEQVATCTSVLPIRLLAMAPAAIHRELRGSSQTLIHGWGTSDPKGVISDAVGDPGAWACLHPIGL